MGRLLFVCGVIAAIGCGGGKGGGNTAGSGGGAGGTTGSGGTSACATGTEGCACYGNDSCNGSLQCFSHLCVSVTGTAGTTAGTAGTSGTGGSAAGTAGTSGTGGSATGAAGATGSGGSATGTAGTTGSGGSAAGSGGSATGTAGTGGIAGTAGRGGTTGTAGSTGTAGTTGTGGSASSNTLTFTAGVITADSNTFGITGGAYTFGDGFGSMITPNCTTDDCFASVTGAGPICVSGIGTRVLLDSSGFDYDYATYWGAAVALDLNNPTNAANAQLPYRPSDHGVKGFQFSFQNRASSVVRLTFKVRDPGTGTLVDYCLDLGTTTSIVHFSDARQQCYAQIPGPGLTAALADHIEGLQWQVPTTPAGAVPFDYCISNITPLLQ